MSAPPSADELAEMQSAVLRAALDASSPLPDRAFLPRDGPAALRDENLAPELGRRLPPTVRVMAAGETAALDTAYLRFQPVSEADGTLWVTLELRLPQSGAADGAVLGGVQVGWRRRVGGAWRVAQPARAYGV